MILTASPAVQQSVVLPEVPLSLTADILKDFSSSPPNVKTPRGQSPPVQILEDEPKSQMQDEAEVKIVDVRQTNPLSSQQLRKKKRLHLLPTNLLQS